MPPRNIKNQIRYKRYRKQNPSGCGFCVAIEQRSEQVIETVGTMSILTNLFPYARWDGRKVRRHLMVVPNRHATTLGSLSEQESDDLHTLMSRYEAEGYSFYIRSDANRSKSMAHLHGHLIHAV